MELPNLLRHNARHLRAGGARQHDLEGHHWDTMLDAAASEIERLQADRDYWYSLAMQFPVPNTK